MVDDFIFGKQHHSLKTNQKQNLESNLEDYKEKMQSTISKNSIKSYVSSFNQVRKYAKFHGLKFDYALFDESFEHQFVDYLINEQNISNNTIGKYLKELGAMMGMFSKHKVVKFFGSKRTEDRKAKWEIITTYSV